MRSEKLWTCPDGTFSGIEDDSCYEILGIRYAQSERFARPKPYSYTEGVHSCDKPAIYAEQLSSDSESYLSGIDYDQLPQEESCQYLSITVPKGNTDSPLPVMVWFHGGAYKNGGCDSKSYDRKPLARENQVIVIGVNYRLGIWGFVKDREGAYANNGLLDIIESLKWVQRNIAAFGGNPENVTIFGQSAGADAVRSLILSQGTDDLYKRAIMQSAPIGTMFGRADMEQKVLDELNTIPLDASVEDLKEAQRSILEHVTEKGLPKYMVFAPHFGVYPLVKEEEIGKKLQNVAKKHELLIGSNTREVAVYLGMNKKLVALDSCFLTRWFIEIFIRKYSRAIFNQPTEEFARQYRQAGGKVYLYSFSWTENHSFFGACHAMDIIPLFGADGYEEERPIMGLTKPELYKKGLPMRALWGHFAKTGTVDNKYIPGMLTIKKL